MPPADPRLAATMVPPASWVTPPDVVVRLMAAPACPRRLAEPSVIGPDALQAIAAPSAVAPVPSTHYR